METERITFALAIFFLHISRQVTTAQDSNEEQQSNYWFQSVELSFWIALGLAFSVILTCLCCIFCWRRDTFLSQPQTPNNRQQTQRTEEGRDNGAFDFSDPPPPYSDALKYALSKDDEGLPEYSETYL